MEYRYIIQNNELKHHGVKGMHWGIRRYQPYPKGSKARKAQKSVEKTLKRSKDWYNAKEKLRSNKYVNLISKDKEIKDLDDKRRKAEYKSWEENNKLKYDKNGNPGKPTKESIDADIKYNIAKTAYKKAVYKKIDSLIGDLGNQRLDTLYKNHSEKYSFVKNDLIRDLIASSVSKNLFEGGSPKELNYVHIVDKRR